MARYKDTKSVKNSTHAKFDQLLKPGKKPNFPGIYKCQQCGLEDVINKECESLPPCAKCQKKPHEWKLLVVPEEPPKQQTGFKNFIANLFPK